MKYTVEKIDEVHQEITIENNLEYEKVVQIEQKIEELQDLVESLKFTSKFGYSLDNSVYKDQEMFFDAREKYDKQRIKKLKS